MAVRRLDDPVEFLELARPILETSEARHNLLYGIVGTLIAAPGVYERHELWLGMRQGAAVAAAVRTPPHYLVLADAADRRAAAELAHAIAAHDPDLPGVNANEPTDGWFVEAWVEAAARRSELDSAQGVLVLTDLISSPLPEGRPRLATHRDTDWLVEWHVAFATEAIPSESIDRQSMRKTIVRRIERAHQSALWLWEVAGEPVALSGHGSPTPHGVRIGPVYTPPPHRGRGFASAVVAHQVADVLASGRRCCFLFTDLANPTANDLYRRIGFRQVATAGRWRFESPE